jgi:putative membrane protein
MSAFNFETPSRQSVKGIVVIFGVSVYKVVRASFIIFAALILKYLSSNKSIYISDPKIIVSVIGVVVFFLVIAFLRFYNFKFHVKNDYFFLRKGIFNKEEISVSISKIQNVYIKQNLLQQIINVVSLSIETAGDDKTEIEISALARPKAEALKLCLLKSSKANQINEAENTDEIVYFKASIKKLLLEGVTENHFKSFLLIFAFVIGVYNDIKDFVEQLDLTSKFGSWFQLDSESFMALLLFNVSLIIVFLIVSFFFSLIKMLIQNFDLTVKRNSKGLEISKGLFNKINLSLYETRIQNTTIITNRLKEAFGLYKLAFTQAMANKKQQLNFNIVGLGKTQIAELLQQFYPNVEDRLIKNKPNAYFKYRLCLIGFFILILINVGLFLGPYELLLLNIPLLIIIFGNVIYAYKKAYYHIDEDYVVIGSGALIETKTDFLEIKKVQAVSLNQTIFQKRRNLASVVLFTASKPITIQHIELNTAFEIKNYLLFKLESENKDWM